LVAKPLVISVLVTSVLVKNGRDLSTSWRYVKVRICVARKIKYLNRMWNRGHSFRRSIDHVFTFSYAKHIQTCTVPSELKKYMPHLQETNLKWLYFGFWMLPHPVWCTCSHEMLHICKTTRIFRLWQATIIYLPEILWMEEILHQLIGGLSHYL
jgi:hypothetical protein